MELNKVVVLEVETVEGYVGCVVFVLVVHSLHERIGLCWFSASLEAC
jgi:hypothetical protein